MIVKFLKELYLNYKEMRQNDPVINCKVHKEIGCAHVDGYLCDMKDCEIRENYEVELAQQMINKEVKKSRDSRLNNKHNKEINK